MKLSVLDYGLLDEGESPGAALAGTVAMARLADQLGYHRFWVAEHHNVHALTISRPELVMVHLANQTQRIRIGSGGIMALHQSSLQLAETISTLSLLVPSRLDIGLGNSLGTRLVSQGLESQHRSGQFAAHLKEVLSLLKQESPEPLANPCVRQLPEFFTLGMGGQSAQLAGELGWGYNLGLFPYLPGSSSDIMAQALPAYRTACGDQPGYAILSVFVAVAETAEAAQELAQSLDVWLLGNQDFNEFKAFPSPERGAAYVLTDQQKERVAHQRQKLLIGRPEAVKAQLDDLLEQSPVDEVMLIPLVAGLDNRLKTLELMADYIS